MSKVEVSIIVPVYNVEEYIEEFLESLFNQTYSNYEIILINDGSTDNSEKIIMRYKEKFSQLKYIYQENTGQAEARNNALKYVEGKYTIYLDPDDYLDSNMLLEMYECAKENNADIVVCGYKKIYTDKEEIILYKLNENTKYGPKKLLNMIANFQMDGYLWNKMFLTKNLIENKINFEKGRVVEDLVPVCKQFSISNTIMYIDKPLYYYRQRQTSTLHTINNKKKIDDHDYAYKLACQIIRNNSCVNMNEYVRFIANLQFFSIKEYKENGFKLNKKVYEQYCVEKFKLRDIILNFKIESKTKLKIILFQINLLDKFI